MTATIQTIDTPDGAFTILADDRGACSPPAGPPTPRPRSLRIHPRLRPDAVARGGDGCRGRRARLLRAATSRPSTPSRSRRTAPRCSSAGWAALRRIAPGRPLTYAEFAAALGQPTRGAGRGIHLRPQRARAVRAVPPRAARRTARSAASPGASRSSAACSRARRRLANRPERRRGNRFALSELPGIGWRAVARPRAHPSAHTPRRMPCTRPPSPRRPAFVLRDAGPRASHRGVTAPPSTSRRPPAPAYPRVSGAFPSQRIGSVAPPAHSRPASGHPRHPSTPPQGS